MGNIKRERFEKVASNRVQKVLKYLDLLSNCSNPYNYEYEQADIDKIFRAINLKLKSTKASFKSELDSTNFKL